MDVLAWSVANWALDCACLVFAYLAVGAGVPWRGLLLAYGAGQLAANLPITPGGLGVVEGSLVIALVAFGGGQVSTVAAVLLYRIVSFWGFLPVGWVFWGGLTWHNRRADQAGRPGAEKWPCRRTPEVTVTGVDCGARRMTRTMWRDGAVVAHARPRDIQPGRAVFMRRSVHEGEAASHSWLSWR